MNKYNNSTSKKETYSAPLCETHVIIPEGMICTQSGEKGGPGSYDENHTNNLGGWF